MPQSPKNDSTPRLPPISKMTLADIPPRLGLFPLGGNLLFPKGRLPLTFFEPRYIALLEDALAHKRMIGVTQPTGETVPGIENPPLEHIGTVGRITSFLEHENGRFSATLTGICRFHLLRDQLTPHGWREGMINTAPFMHDLLEESAIPLDREELTAILKRYLKRHNLQTNWDTLEKLDDESLLTTLPMLLPLTRSEKQYLLEADDLDERATRLFSILMEDSRSSPS